jgi:hypothetical protein
LWLLADDHAVRPHADGANGFLAADATTGQRSLLLGILLAVYPLGQFLGSPVLGALSDRYGRKPILTVSLFIAVAAYLLISRGIELRSLALIATGCLIGGLAESNIAIAQSAISDVAGPDERPRLFAWIYSCCSLGYIAGPVIGGELAVLLSWSAPFWLTVPLLVATLVWIGISFRETHPPEKDKRIDAFAALTNLGTVFTDRPIRRLYLINFLIYLGLFGYFRMVLVYMVDHCHTTGRSDHAYLLRPRPDLRRRELQTDGAAHATMRSEPGRDRFGDTGWRDDDIDYVSCTTRLDLDHRRTDGSDRDACSLGMPDGAFECGFRGAARPRHGQQSSASGRSRVSERSNRRCVGGDSDPVAPHCLRHSTDWSRPGARPQFHLAPGSFPKRTGRRLTLVMRSLDPAGAPERGQHGDHRFHPASAEKSGLCCVFLARLNEVGVRLYVDRKHSLKRLTLPKPAAKAISANGMVVSSMRRFAFCTRFVAAISLGVAPV